MISINPYTNLVIQKYNELSDEELNDRLSKVGLAFEDWRRTGSDTRREMMSNVAFELRKNIEKYSLTITREMGKVISESKAEVEKCAWLCEYYAENASHFLANEKIVTDAYDSFVRYDPLGTILGIMPWNFPFWQVFRFAVPTLMAGNTAVLKHASNVQGCASLIEKIFNESGFPESVFINLCISSSRVDGLIENLVIKGISLTGSEIAGRQVAESAGRNIKKSLMELGGSNAFIVLADADLDKAAETGLKARMMNAGQSCIAAKRFIIEKKIIRKFTELFLERIRQIRQGDPERPETTMGPLASIQQAEILEDQVSRSINKGARILVGGKRENAFFTPTVLDSVEPGMSLFDEEIFGPVAPIIAAKDIAEALRLAGRTDFGLGVTIFTEDLDNARRISSEFRDGAVFVNDLVKSDPRLPFGGTGKSGYGRELARQGIQEFTNIKSVYIRKL
jgi:succinate-semialdehyde dehydrogenase / glutarate-semialdehyde dehydrogenase